MENAPNIKFIQNYIRDPGGVFSTSSLVRILMTSFPACAWLFVQMASDRFVKLSEADVKSFSEKRQTRRIKNFTQNLRNYVENPDNFRTSTGFEPATSRYRCDALTN